jgi:hypothetical protein
VCCTASKLHCCTCCSFLSTVRVSLYGSYRSSLCLSLSSCCLFPFPLFVSLSFSAAVCTVYTVSFCLFRCLFPFPASCGSVCTVHTAPVCLFPFLLLVRVCTAYTVSGCTLRFGLTFPHYLHVCWCVCIQRHPTMKRCNEMKRIKMKNVFRGRGAAINTKTSNAGSGLTTCLLSQSGIVLPPRTLTLEGILACSSGSGAGPLWETPCTKNKYYAITQIASLVMHGLRLEPNCARLFSLSLFLPSFT